jgi:hypothetical protein
VGRASRTVTPAQLKALQVRDGGCVHPGCSRTAAFCDAHHVVHWADGGLTDLPNLVLLCRHHHRTLHAGYWRLVPGGSPRPTGDVDRDRRAAHPPPVYHHHAALPGGYVTPLQAAADRSPPLGPTG